MKSSYNPPHPKPKSAQVSKKNSGISSLLYKEAGEHIKGCKDIKSSTRRDRPSRNSQNNVCDRENNIKACNQQARPKNTTKNDDKPSKQQPMPFAKLNNYMGTPCNEPLLSIFDNKKSLKNTINLPDDEGRPAQSTPKTSKKSFQYKYIIGKGGFGKVWKIEHVKTRNQYAMKQMLKSLVMTKKSVQSVMNERLLLSGLSSPFIVNMHYAFQDRDTLYLVLDLLEGGDLRHHISTKRFSEIQAKFFISCIVIGLEYLHNNKIIHRDIKPQNLVLDSRGYVRITDLGIARVKKANNSCDTSGTPGYMAPEILCRMNHGYVSDFYALGVIAYELATGKRPHNAISRAEIREQILAKQAAIKRHEIPQDWSEDCLDFINRLLQRKPEQRLGFNGGAEELKNHPWIRDLNWRKLASREIESPYVPAMKKSDFDQDEQITIEDQQQAEIIEKNAILLRKPEFQELFKQYQYESSGTVLNDKKPSKQELQSSSKLGLYSNTRRKNSAGAYNNIVSIKGSYANLKKTNVSTNNSTEINNISSTNKNQTKTPEGSSRNVSGNLQRKSDANIKLSKETVLNVSECLDAYGLDSRASREKQRGREKQRPFFRN